MNEPSTKPPVPFKELKEDYEDKQIVMTIAGKITALYDIRKGDTYEYQPGKMKDDAGTEMDICFSKATQPLTAKGKHVVIKSIKSDKHGWLGIKVEDQTFTKDDETVTKRLLKITASAEIVYDGEAAQSSGKSKPTGEGKQQQQKTDGHPIVILDDLLALHRKCYEVVQAKYSNANLPHEAQQPFVSTLFIEMCRQNQQHNFIERAAKPLPPKITPAPEDPKQWRDCMIPSGSMVGKTLKDLDAEGLTKFYDALKDKETKFANCVKSAYEETGLLKARQDAEAKATGENQALKPEDVDDIPF